MRLLSITAWLYWFFVGVYPVTLPHGGTLDTKKASIKQFEQLACIENPVFPLNDYCQVVISPQEVLRGGDGSTNWGRLRVMINDRNPFNFNIADGIGRFAFLVRDTLTGAIICQSTLTTEDKLPPEIITIDWQRDTLEWLCYDLDSILNVSASWKNTNYSYYTGSVAFTDNCNTLPSTFSVNDRLTLGNCDSGFYAKIYRHFSIQDPSGNQKDTTQVIVFGYPDWRALHFPRDTAIHSCIPETVRTPELYPYWINAVGDTVVLYPGVRYCNLAVQRQVTEILTCQRGRKVIQTLRIFDWCVGDIVKVDTTLMKIGDLEAPLITKTNQTIVVSTQPNSCTAVMPVNVSQLQRLYSINFSDCDAIQLSIKVKSYVFRPLSADSVWQEYTYPVSNGLMSNLPIGKHRFILYAYDNCQNTRKDSIEFQVKDKISPIARCKNAINLSMSNGYGRLSVADINENSSDNCQLKSLKIRRVVSSSCVASFDQNNNGKLEIEDDLSLENGLFYTQPADRIDFFCCDLNTKVRVELIAQDQAGNTNTCWLDVLVEDKSPLLCSAPADTSILCTDKNLDQLAAFGKAIALNDPCGISTIIALPDIYKLNNCGVGSITRRWQLVRNLGKTNEQRSPECQQIITVTAIRDYSIRFPRDTAVNCTQIPVAEKLIYQENGCNILAFTVKDDRFTASGQECYKILRTWTVINWCEYTDGTQPVILDRDYDGDGQRGNAAFWLIIDPDGTTYIDKDQNAKNNVPNSKGHWTSSLERPLLQSRGIWEYTQIIEVYDRQAPSISLPSGTVFDARNSDCTGDVIYQFSLNENCNTSDLKIEVQYDEKADGKTDRNLKLSGTYPRFRVQERLPIGIHRLHILATDGCGNLDRKVVQIEVRDAKGPVPICINGLVVNLMPLPIPEDIDGDGDIDPGVAVIWAKDFISSKSEDCSGIVAYSIHRAEDIESGREKPNPEHSSVALTCDDRPSVLVYVYAWDARGNYGYCETYVLVQDTRKLCPAQGNASISGTIKTFTNLPVQNVEVKLSGPQVAESSSNNQGQFGFEQLKENQDYSVTPKLNTNHLDGVTTYDIVLITRHILGVAPFDSPYKYLAADVDSSGYISTLDIIQIRKVILRLDLEFKKCPSWRFVDAAYTFKDKNNPLSEDYPESRHYNNLNSEMLGADFVAIKMGDVSGNATRDNFTAATELRSASRSILELGALPEILQTGTSYQVPLHLLQAEQLAGAQFCLQFDTDALDFTGITYQSAQAESFGLSETSKGLIRVSWLNSKQKNGQLAILNFQAKKSLVDSNLIQLSTRDLSPEAYTLHDVIQKIVLRQFKPKTENSTQVYQLYPNIPNPFSRSTTITFDLAKAGPAILRISDLSGRTLRTVQAEYSAGHHQVVIDKGDLNQSGVLLYTLQASEFQKTMKMVVY